MVVCSSGDGCYAAEWMDTWIGIWITVVWLSGLDAYGAVKGMGWSDAVKGMER